MKNFIATALVTVGFSTALVADVIYINDDFEGEPTGTFSDVANSTGFINTGNTLSNTTIISEINSTGDQSQDPSGQHLRITGNRDKHVTQQVGMTLLSDGVQFIHIVFKLHFNAVSSQNIARLIYSAAGDFSDQIVLQSFVTSAAPDPSNFLYGATQWYAVSYEILPTDVGGVFTDSAKIRFAQDTGGAISTHAMLDDIVVTGVNGVVPEPTSLALFVLGAGLVAARRRV